MWARNWRLPGGFRPCGDLRDKEQAKVARLNEGHIPIYEPGLAAIVERNAKAGRLFFVTEIAPAVQSAMW